ncbi:hypothetical protein SCATT_11830 [Streptantibioticus cattleyicolor NRRL 8057 = DSM 46488]|uniref:Uncharacterized protein n=1 Tax=Streptantibioticus cattleyicolor (strain ATCC 35852 / DSM 46488 / JCM 4925 / NBRC 14057 / NRRL 8057) TaxID=1003195 RepID=G8WRH7_STREN|nr:hypothetical protein SCATT_11830 [Streptantibioticus cattleyicolor NRRL 8057 = DSM 46488]
MGEGRLAHRWGLSKAERSGHIGRPVRRAGPHGTGWTDPTPRPRFRPSILRYPTVNSGRPLPGPPRSPA